MTSSHRIVLSFAAVALLSSPAHAQKGPRWSAWAGCWSTALHVTAQPGEVRTKALVCVKPTASVDAAEIAFVVDGKVVSRDTVDASGTAHTMTLSACTGVQRASWAADERRVFMRSTLTCPGVVTETSTMLAITESGDWLDVRRVTAGGVSDIAVARYHGVAARETPAEFSPVDRAAAQSARTLAGAPISADALVDAARLTDADVMKAFVMESGASFPTDTYSLAHLADAGVAPSVTDAMLALKTESQSSPVVIRQNLADRQSESATRSRFEFTFYPDYNPWDFGFHAGYPFGLSQYGAPFGGYTRLAFGIGFGGFGNYNAVNGNRSMRAWPVGYYYPPVLVLHQEPAKSSGTQVATKTAANDDEHKVTPVKPKDADGSKAAAAPTGGNPVTGVSGKVIRP